MVNPAATSSEPDLPVAIASYPFTCQPTDTVLSVIAQFAMPEKRSPSPRDPETCAASVPSMAQQPSCVVVTTADRPVGILTERHLVSLVAQGLNLEETAVEAVMTIPVATLPLQLCADIFVPLAVLRRHQIQHLPIVDDRGLLQGIITENSLCQQLPSIPLWQSLTVAHVMTDLVTAASTSSTLAELAQMMTDHQQGFVLIMAPDPPLPMGIVTAGDIVQSLALGLDLAHVLALSRINPSWVLVPTDLSLQATQRLMQDWQVNVAVVTQEDGVLAGIVTSATLLRLLDPVEIYRLVEGLIPEPISAPPMERAIPERVGGETQADVSSSQGKILQDLNQDLQTRVAQYTAALLKSEERLWLAAELAHKGLYDLNIQTGEVRVSPEYATLLGYDPASFQNTNIPLVDWLHPDDRDRVTQSLQDYIASIVPNDQMVPDYRIEFRQLTQSGAWKWILLLGKIVAWDERDQPLRMLGIYTDITERKQAELAQARLAAIIESSADAIISKTLQGKVVSWNAGAEAIFGYTAAEMIGQSITLLIPPDHLSEEDVILQKLSQGIPIKHYETLRRHKQGQLIPISLTVSPIKDAAGNIVGASKIARDISERKQAEAERLKAEQLLGELHLLESILDIIFAGYWDWNLQTNQEYFSSGFKRMLGYADQDLPNAPETWQHLIFAEDLPGLLDCLEHHVQSHGDQPFYNEVRYHHQDGSTVWVICSGQVIQWDAAGAPVRMIGCHINISARKQSELKLLQTTAQLQASNQELEAFAYSVSHDLRAPLRAIDGFSIALLEDYGDQFNEEGKGYFARIRSNIKQMGLLIDDLLRLSRVSRSEMKFEKVNLSELTQNAIHEWRTLEPERQVEVIVAPEIVVFADPTLMRITINNLIDNAWKFTSHHPTARIEFGTITINEHKTYFVRDDGAGFDMAYANLLFGVFQRLHNTHEFPGTGIGLATVQRIIHRHGGLTWAESVVEQGTTIYFTLPNS